MKKIILITNCFVFLFFSYLLAANKVDKGKPDELSGLQEQARAYRIEGVKSQELGDLDSALQMYQKAARLDPAYYVVYNDLGIIYEAKGDIGRAEENYLRVLKIEPSFPGAYTNLACLYENKRELEKAVYYWKKRVELGDPDDPWTFKAWQRLEDVRLALSGNPEEEARRRETIDLIREVSDSKKSAGKARTKNNASLSGQRGYSPDIDEAQKLLNGDTTQNSYNL
ncbi:MAG: tetratricopeptide repeat protein [Candidatus Omnitrophota bacterium]